MKKFFVLLSFLLAFCHASAVSANMRAPMHIVKSPSSTLYRTDPRLKVSQEKLDVTCTGTICEVDASYRIEAGKSAMYRFEFIMPSRSNARVTVNERQVPATTIPIEPRNEKEKMYLAVQFNRNRAGLFQATFRAKLESGSNHIRVYYRQPMSAIEAAYGYFRKSRFIHQFRYEIWPLKQWQLAKDFSMKITFKTRSSFSILKAVRGRSFRAQCHGLHHTRCRHGLCAERKPLKTSRVKKGNYTVSRIELGNSFPDVLVCTTGDRDLVRRK